MAHMLTVSMESTGCYLQWEGGSGRGGAEDPDPATEQQDKACSHKRSGNMKEGVGISYGGRQGVMKALCHGGVGI